MQNVIELRLFNSYLKLLKTQKLPALDEGRVDLGVVQTVIQATEQETVKRIIIKKKGSLGGKSVLVETLPAFH